MTIGVHAVLRVVLVPKQKAVIILHQIMVEMLALESLLKNVTLMFVQVCFYFRYLYYIAPSNFCTLR